MTWLDEALADGRLAPEKVGVIELPVSTLWRVYPRPCGAAGFNRGGIGDARFSPLEIDGQVVPTLYAATTLEAALMETVFHDAPHPSHGFHLVLQEASETRRVAQLRASTPLRLVDLSAVGLRRLGLTRADVVDSDVADYRCTRALAAWLWRHAPHAQGLRWSSRQDDTAQALVLFEPRLAPTVLQPLAEGEFFTRGPHLETLLALAERLGAGVLLR